MTAELPTPKPAKPRLPDSPLARGNSLVQELGQAHWQLKDALRSCDETLRSLQIALGEGWSERQRMLADYADLLRQIVQLHDNYLELPGPSVPLTDLHDRLRRL